MTRQLSQFGIQPWRSRSVSHVRWLKLGFTLFSAVSQIFGLARLILARLSPHAIFSHATATLQLLLQLHGFLYAQLPLVLL